MTRPRPLGWLHLLLAGVLLGIALVAGNVYFYGDGDAVTRYAVGITVCERKFPPPYDDAEHGYAYLRCLARPEQVRKDIVLTAAVAVAVAFGCLLVLVPLIDRLRLRRHRGRYVVEPATARFGQLCERHGLTGSSRPGLLVAGPPVRQAFTTATPGRRPLIVLPLAVALAHADPGRFDVVVEHEIAHVRARDVVWVNGLRGLALLTLPVMVAATAPGVLNGFDSRPGVAAALRGLGIALAVVPLTAYLLRLREREADRYVAAAGRGAALSRLLAQAPPAARRPGPLRRALARHPAPADRLAALSRPEASAEGGFGHAALVGAVAMITATAVDDLFLTFSRFGTASDSRVIAAAAASAMLSGGLGPSLLRRCRRLRDAGLPRRWWRPAAGLATGLVLGRYLLPTRPTQLSTTFLNLPGWSGAVVMAVLLAVSGAVLVSAAALLAEPLAGLRHRPGSGWLRVMSLLALGATGTGLIWTLPVLDGVVRNDLRLASLAWGLSNRPWPLLALALPLGLLLLVIAAGPAGGVLDAAARRAVAAGSAIGATAVVAHSTVVRFTTDYERWLQLEQERAWLCAIAGLAVLLGVAAGRGDASPARALTGGALVTIVVSAVQLGAEIRGDRPVRWFLVRLTVGLPVTWYCVAALLLTPVLLWWAGRRVRVPVRHAAAITAAITAMAGVVMLGPGVPTAGPERKPAARPGPVATATSIPAGPPADPGRPLTEADLRRIVAAAVPALPSYWRLKAVENTVDEPDDTTRIVPPECGDVYRLAFLDDLGVRPVRQFRGSYGTDVTHLVSSSLTITANTTAAPIPAGAEAAAMAGWKRCRSFVLPAAPPAHDLKFRLVDRPDPGFGTQSWTVAFDLSSGPARATQVVVVVIHGRNMLTFQMTGVLESVDEALLTEAVARTVDALSH
ncbi:M48 family metallopeptidase [Actinoplanes siamensis]|uniref:Peptidase M48 domain-containing protein n=1 Tax=Actinoplanes siamensis TaxID=1223317 RepID=A0A919TN66_9ACTN|nr:M48 family metalloprotease [Actinoplanes siamensis]GIF08407.1 hypothetical protein Asi03nite_59450 [Actinoplanes siamensis]